MGKINSKYAGKHPEKSLKITIKTLFGLEEVLQEELNEMGYESVILNRAVQLQGELKDVYYLNLHCRCALSILIEIANFRFRNEKDLYHQAKKINWTDLFDVNKTIAIKGFVKSTLFRHSQYPFLLLKDAIVDVFRDITNCRPDINKDRPQVVLDLHINENMATISMNTSGAPLYQRGYRENVGEAPINEVLAAGLIKLTKWDKKSPLIDPFCGSGTILIEAMLLAANVPSMIERRHYAFKNFKNYDEKLWQEIYDEAYSKMRSIKNLPVMIKGSDISSEMVLKTKRNLRVFPFGRFVETSKASFDELKDLNIESGTMITNPPYGERIGGHIGDLYSEIGDWMKKELNGFDCWVISSSEDGLKAIGLKASSKTKLFNGSLECSFRSFNIYKGSKKEVNQEGFNEL